MRRIVTLLVLGIACTALGIGFIAILVQLVGLFEPRVVIEVSLKPREEALNDFIFNESGYCRPFLSSTNPQVVRITSRFSMVDSREHSTNCSGVIVGPRSVLTAKHCLELTGGTLVGGAVTTLTGEFEVESSAPDPADDIVLLVVNKPLEIEPAQIARQVPLAVTLEGFGCLQRPSIFPLQRQAVTVAIHDRIVFLAGCVCHGDSGGPIFDDNGALVALMFWTENDGKNGRGILIQEFIDHKPSRIQ